MEIDNFFFEIHEDLPREGPGNFESTKKAFSYLSELPDKPNILDVGCGPGMQTIHLALISNGQITAVDKFKKYLEPLNDKIESNGFGDRIETKVDDMFNLDQPEEHFDLIWSEGAIYILGFEEGLSRWKKHLKRGGYIAVTEITWLRNDPPVELKNFWDEGYPAMKNVEQNLGIIKKCGYETIAYFTLPTEAWFADYYDPLQKRVAMLKEKYVTDSAKIDLLNMELTEIELYKKYHDYYSYVFYIMKKN